MKNKIYTILMLVGLIYTFQSCDKGKPEAPEACVTSEIGKNINGVTQYVESTTVIKGDPVYFSFCGKADYFVIYPGDSLHVLPTSENDTINRGFAMTLGNRYSYIYRKAGVYPATLLTTNVSVYSSRKAIAFAKSTATVMITVIDTTTIQ